jgi:hypothetical protein
MTSNSKTRSDAFYRERVLRSRQMTDEECMVEGIRLFEAEQARVRAEFFNRLQETSAVELPKAVRRHFHLPIEQERGPDFYERLRCLPMP